jgi:hypothetical protein
MESRNPQRPNGVERHDAIFLQIYEDIRARMKLPKGNNTKPSKQFICLADLKAIWSRHDRMTHIFWPRTLEDVHRNYLSEKMMKLLSCLVYVIPSPHAIKPLIELWRANITDCDLPLRKDQLGVISDPAVQENFIEQQYAFIPYVIIFTPPGPNSSDILTISDEHVRLPFESIEKGIGIGGYGVVDKVGISALHLHDRRSGNSSVNDKVSEIQYVGIRLIGSTLGAYDRLQEGTKEDRFRRRGAERPDSTWKSDKTRPHHDFPWRN